MHAVEPKAFLVGETATRPGMLAYLEHVGAPEWESVNPGSEGEALIEAMGRLCYRSWRAGMNANVTRTREGNDVYLEHIIKVGHGSVLEHASSNWIFADVSRVFTHELVRHRVGTAFSQESLRYVRLEELGLWIPPEVTQYPDALKLFQKVFMDLEAVQVQLAEIFDLDAKPMDEKKKLTSAMRRLAPIGLATSIGFTMNARTLRHLLIMRTSRFAEVEIRNVFNQVGEIARVHWPHIVADFKVEEVDGLGEWTTENIKV